LGAVKILWTHKEAAGWKNLNISVL